MMMYVSVFKLNERKNNAKQIAVLKQEIDGLGATNQAKQLAKQAAEKNAMVNKLISTVRGKALQSKTERLNSTKKSPEKTPRYTIDYVFVVVFVKCIFCGAYLYRFYALFWRLLSPD